MANQKNPKTTIELNGKLYDARTGRMISEPSLPPSQTPSKSHNKHTTGTALDGFKPVSYAETPSFSNLTNQVSAQAAISKAPTASRNGGLASHTSRRPQKSKTLMRPAVKKPAHIKEKQLTKSQVLAKEDPGRKARAQQVPKSTMIKRFNMAAAGLPAGHVPSIQKKSAVLPVASQHNFLANKATEIAHATEAQISQSAQTLDNAIANASSHLMTLEKNLVEKKSLLESVLFKNKKANLATVFATVALLFGFFAYQNAANVEMRVAATRSGISAQLPGYRPAGFGITDRISVDSGKVTVTFKSRTDDRQFRLTQQASNWSSDALLSNHVLSSNQPYQTYHANKAVRTPPTCI